MTLVVAIGGVRSGKSAWAEQQAEELSGGTPVTVLATGDPADASMADRIARHRSRRPGTWTVRELHGKSDLAAALPPRGVALLDGLGGWVASLLDESGAFVDDPGAARAAARRASSEAHAAIQALIDGAAHPNRALVVATEESGLGVVPMGAGTAAWVDLLGELNQRLVRSADSAVVVVAGRALPLTEAGHELRRPDVGPPLTVVTSTQPPSAPLVDDRERRAFPRLVGAKPARTARPEGLAHAMPLAPLPAAGGGPAGKHAADTATLRLHGDRLVRPGDADHAVNIAAQGPPVWLSEALAGVLAGDGLTRYPDARVAEEALAKVYGRPADQIVATNGAAHALWLLPAALRPRLAACVHPLFTEAEVALHAHGVPVVRVHRDAESDFALDPRAVPDAADLVIIGNPAAACGALAARETILALRRPGRIIVVDEAFMDLVPGERETLTGDDADDLIVVRSFTKSLSVPGVRCGAALAAPRVAAQLRAVLPPWSVNAFAIAALVALAEHPEDLPARATRAAAERNDLIERLAALPGVRVWPSHANHVLVGVERGAEVVEALRSAQIAVRPCGSFPGLTDDHLRLTARDPEANAILVAALAQALDGAATTQPAT